MHGGGLPAVRAGTVGEQCGDNSRMPLSFTGFRV